MGCGRMCPDRHYVRILAGMKQRRDLLMLCHRAMTLAYEPSSDMRKAIESLQEQALKISIETDSKYEDIFLDVEKFCNQYNEQVEWLVQGVIEKGTNGIMIGASGDGKSPCVRALAVCLASGTDWLDLRCKRVRTALVSREDYAGTTSRFIKRFRGGMESIKASISERGCGYTLASSGSRCS
jgi:RecA-family ATPase